MLSCVEHEKSLIPSGPDDESIFLRRGTKEASLLRSNPIILNDVLCCTCMFIQIK